MLKSLSWSFGLNFPLSPRGHLVQCCISPRAGHTASFQPADQSQEHLQLWFLSTWALGLCCGFKGHTATLMPKPKNLLLMRNSWERVDKFGLCRLKETRESWKRPALCSGYIFIQIYYTNTDCVIYGSNWTLWVQRVHWILASCRKADLFGDGMWEENTNQQGITLLLFSIYIVVRHIPSQVLWSDFGLFAKYQETHNRNAMKQG